MAKSPDKKLTPQQEKFAQEFVLTGIGAEAYRKAYPRSLKWKDNSVYTAASLLLSDAKVSQRVDELRAEIKERFDISAERLLLEQSRIALFDYRKLFDEDGRLVDVTRMPDEVAAAVSSVKINRVKRTPVEGDAPVDEEVVELKLWNKNTALDSLFKNAGLYERDNKRVIEFDPKGLPKEIADMVDSE